MSALAPTGWVNWPDPTVGDIYDAGDGGLWVFAFWPARYDTLDDGMGEPVKAAVDSDNLRDPFVSCFGAEHVITLAEQDCVVSDNEEVIYPQENHPPYVSPTGDPEAREQYLVATHNAGVPVLGAICLGTTPHALFDAKRDHFWQCAFDDLTWAGKRLIRQLNKLYGRNACLITYLDT